MRLTKYSEDILLNGSAIRAQIVFEGENSSKNTRIFLLMFQISIRENIFDIEIYDKGSIILGENSSQSV